MDNLARLKAELERLSPAELRLVLKFAEFLAEEQRERRSWEQG
ncbi:unnamed protein product [marine sediment metagenome]|uniref:Uncharacterized protein n=1 Tax=marine sediment metagenome TaxID=412755 RepID=X1QLL3_9ZZZZ